MTLEVTNQHGNNKKRHLFRSENLGNTQAHHNVSPVRSATPIRFSIPTPSRSIPDSPDFRSSHAFRASGLQCSESPCIVCSGLFRLGIVDNQDWPQHSCDTEEGDQLWKHYPETSWSTSVTVSTGCTERQRPRPLTGPQSPEDWTCVRKVRFTEPCMLVQCPLTQPECNVSDADATSLMTKSDFPLKTAIYHVRIFRRTVSI